VTKRSIQCGLLGSTLGILAGLVELSIGAQIRPWIGDKSDPAVLGLVTFLLSGMALAAFIVARRREMQTNDGKLAIFLSALLPAVICFTTVGRLWYLPGTLLMVAVALLAYEFWMTPQGTVSSGTSGRAWRLIAGVGSLVILLSIGLAFWKSAFGLFHAEVSGHFFAQTNRPAVTTRALAATDAHGDDAILQLSTASFQQNMTRHARTRHSIGVAD